MGATVGGKEKNRFFKKIKIKIKNCWDIIRIIDDIKQIKRLNGKNKIKLFYGFKRDKKVKT